MQYSIREKQSTVIRGANTPGICKCGQMEGRQDGDEREREECRLEKSRGIRNESLGGNQRHQDVCRKKRALWELHSRN